ncbi:MAG: phage tail protein [Phormidesmis priestleyi]|uniref:Phage tail protein n=1 Tax=Phormidesmis priestleyi TaxID=268141 RepID=A0A2W4X9P4_9CYAN|nr:MAG: phage tail protein [Phormidesmis priestleyi]
MPPLMGGYSLLNAHTNVPNVRLDPYMAYNFVVELSGLITGGFSEISGLESEVEVEEYREGGVNGYVHQFPSQVKHPNLVLSRGLVDGDVMWDWYWLTAQGRPLLLNGTVMLLDSQRLPVMWWTFKDAYPVKWVGPTFDASSDTQVGVEQIELVHRGIVKPALSQALSAVRAGLAIAASPSGINGL